MSSFSSPARLQSTTLSTHPLRLRSKSTGSSSVKCLSSSSFPRDQKSSNSNLLKNISKTVIISSAATFLLQLSPLSSQFPSGLPDFLIGGSDGSGGGRVDGFGGNGGSHGWFGGSGGDGNGGFWSSFFSPAVAMADEGESQEWDLHGLPANIVVQLSKLSNFKKYKLSEILFFDRNKRTTVGTEDSFFEMVSLRPGGVYTKAQLQKELETLATCGMFEKVDMEGKTKPDGTIGMKISFTESMWESADKFQCINVGLMQQSKPIEMDSDMTDKEKLEYFKAQERDYKRRIDKAKKCLLPMQVHSEILDMLAEQGKVSARLLQKIRDRVQQWYHDEGYACAQVVNFGNLNTKEVVCEVVEGDITQLVIQFQDKL